MAASVSDIRDWFRRGLADEDKPTHMIVVCDTYDWDDYPVYVYPKDDVREIEKKFQGNMQKVMEVYNLKLSIDEQTKPGSRVFNY